MKIQIGGADYEVEDAVGIELVRLQTTVEIMGGKPTSTPSSTTDAAKPAAAGAAATTPAATPAAAAAPAAAPAGEKKPEMRADATVIPIEKKKTDAELSADRETAVKAEGVRFELINKAMSLTKRPIDELLRLDAAEIQLAVIKAIDPTADEAALKEKGPVHIGVAYEYALKSQEKEDLRVDSAADLARATIGVGSKSTTGKSEKIESPLTTAAAAYNERLVGKTTEAKT